MKSEKRILIAFILNTVFSVFELFGGIYTGSAAIISDALHDAGDALSIGISLILEKKSKKQPDEKHTYGYTRYSVAGGIISSVILLIGSATVIHNAINKIINPSQINTNAMIIFAVIGVAVNSAAVFFTSKRESLNSKTVHLHMLEDVLGWVAVLIGSIVIKLTGFALIDPIISIIVAIFICIRTMKILKEAADLFLEKTPHNIDINKLKKSLCMTEGVIDIHHIHIRSLDGCKIYTTMHIVTNKNPLDIKQKIRNELRKQGICHSTLEFETENEHCEYIHCYTESENYHIHRHH